MNKRLAVLGCSTDTIAVIFDMLKECWDLKTFQIFKNLEDDIQPNLTLSLYAYEIHRPPVLPESNVDAVFGLSGPFNKWSVFEFFLNNAGISKKNYPVIVHPSSYIASSATLNNGLLIEPHVVISSQAIIGFGVNIKRGSLIGHHNKIGDFVDINPGVVISGKVKVGKGSEIGSGAVLIDNIEIGENCLIGAGSVVTRNIPSESIAYGSPCRVVRRNNRIIT